MSSSWSFESLKKSIGNICAQACAQSSKHISIPGSISVCTPGPDLLVLVFNPRFAISSYLCHMGWWLLATPGSGCNLSQ